MANAAYAEEIVEAFSLRIPTHLRQRVLTSARASRRSLNSEILTLIERALPAETKEAEGTAIPSASN